MLYRGVTGCYLQSQFKYPKQGDLNILVSGPLSTKKRCKEITVKGKYFTLGQFETRTTAFVRQ